MLGKEARHRVILIKVCFAVLLMGFCLPLWAGIEADSSAVPGISQMHASAAPAAKQWSSSRKTQYSSAAPSPKTPVYPQRRFDGVIKFMASGLLGGLLCSFLFGYPMSLYWSQGNLPVGFLDVIFVTTAVYAGYRRLRPVRKGVAMYIPGFAVRESLGPAVFTIKNEAGAGLARFSHTNSTFNLETFVEYARQTIFDLHDAWNHEDLDRIKDRVAPPMLEFMGMGLKILKFRGEISRVEDLTLSQIVVLMARQEEGRDIITIAFQGQVVDYLMERRSFKLISGSMAYPEILQECWTFERQWGSRSWLLTDIQDSRFFIEHEAA
jgi:predicted lipid-binding transport protein (Tim44 family)